MRILLTGGRCVSTLNLSRQLCQSGARVFVADSLPYNITALSSSIWRSYLAPPAKQEPMRFAYALLDIIRKEAIDILIPTSDEIYTILQYEKLLRPHVEIFAPSHQDALRAHSPFRFSEWMKEIHLPAITVDVFRNKQTLAQNVQKIGKNRAYRPEWSSIIHHTKPMNSLWVAQSDCSPQVPWVAQECIKGSRWYSYSWLHNGTVLLHSQYKERSETHKTIAHTTHPKIESWVYEFGQKTQYTGQISICFVEKENVFYAQSSSAQITEGIHCFRGCNLIEVLKKKKQTSLCINHPIQAGHCIFHGHTSSFIPPARSAWIYNILYLRSDICTWFDPIPAWGLFIPYIIIVYRAFRRGISQFDASVSDIEWSTER